MLPIELNLLKHGHGLANTERCEAIEHCWPPLTAPSLAWLDQTKEKEEGEINK